MVLNPGAILCPRGHLTMSDDRFDCHKLGEGVTVLWLQGSDAVKNVTLHKTGQELSIIQLKLLIVLSLRNTGLH